MDEYRHLLTADRRRIYAALRNGCEVVITPEQRAINRQTGDDLGCQIAALEVRESGVARWRRGVRFVLELDVRQMPAAGATNAR